jgi:hypothetical protein
MIAHYDIIQKSFEWHEIKYGKIGGTLAKSIFGDPDTLKNELISARMEDFWHEDDEFGTRDMLRGLMYEPEAREKVSEVYGIQFNQCGWIQSTEIPIAGISPDGISPCETIQLEIKCPSRKVHTKYVRNGGVPAEHVPQCIHAFTVNPKLKRLIFASYRPECLIPLFHKEITLSTELNVGTEKTPVMMTVRDRVEQAKQKLIKIQEDVDREVARLSF